MIKDGELTNRMEPGAGAAGPGEPKGSDKVRADIAKVKGAKDRLAGVKKMPVPDHACPQCFTAGRDRAVAELEVDGPLEERLAAARALQPRHDHNGDRSFQIARDAVISAVTGEGNEEEARG